MKQMPWKDAIVRVLKEHGEPLHYDEIAGRISESGLRTSLGKTPAATVASVISQSKNDPDPLFERVERGRYRLVASGGAIGTAPKEADAADEVGGIATAFGMYWDREDVNWGPTRPKLLGRQKEKSDQVDFSDQIGVYLLHDRREVVYVGQSNEEKKHSSIGQRLRHHTRDRLTSRWDRFSWFGLNPVDKSVEQTTWNVASGSSLTTAIIDVMEAVLIEAMEPRQNRQGGRYFDGLEFMQVVDPKFKRDRAIQDLQSD